MCLSRTHYDIEIEHVLLKLLDASDGDLAYIARHYEIDKSRLAAELTRSIDKFKSGNARTPALSPSVLKMLTEAWTLGSIDYGTGKVRSGLALLALLTNDELSRMARDFSKELQKIPPDGAAQGLPADHRVVTGKRCGGRGCGGAGGGHPARGRQRQDAQSGSVHRQPHRECPQRQDRPGAGPRFRNPAGGRHSHAAAPEQSHPGGRSGRGQDRGGGGFRAADGAGRRASGRCKNVTVRTLDLALLQAGAGVKGEFENRLKGLIEEVKSSPTPIILFIDEAHTMIGAGGQAGQNDAANLLKPALARGELRTIAATTWSEYKKYFEKDPALARRFQVVKVEEPTEEQCAADDARRGRRRSRNTTTSAFWTRGCWPAVKLSHRYLPDRQLPDKAVSVLDTACARLALGQNTDSAGHRRRHPHARRSGRADARSGARSRGWAPTTPSAWQPSPTQQAATEARLADLQRALGQRSAALVEQIREIRGQAGRGGGAAKAGSRRRGAARAA